MNTTDWLKAARDGRVDNAWAELCWSEAGHDMVLRVSSFPARVDGRIRSIDAYTQQLVGDVLKVEGEPLIMPTPKVLALRHSLASVVVPPVFNYHWLGDPLGEERWEEEFLRKLGAASGSAARWLVSDCGKPWTICHLSTANGSLCEGFFGTEEVLRQLGVPHGPTEVPGVYAVRVPDAHGNPIPDAYAGHHMTLRQGDYSGHGVWTHPVMQVDGADRLTREVLMDPMLGSILCGAKGPLPFWRHPGVPSLIDAPEWLALGGEA